MLVLSRRNGESVQIGDEVVVKVLSVSGNHVKLGFSAPPEVTIRRGELVATVSVPLDLWQGGHATSGDLARAVC